jgi:DNA-binding CsgD family transcriptional regulator
MLPNKLENNLELRVNILEHSLSKLGQCIALLSSDGNILFLSDNAKEIINNNDGLMMKDATLLALLPQDNERLQGTLFQLLAANSNSSAYNSIYIHRKSNKKPYQLLFSKIELGDMPDDDECIMVIIKDTDANNSHWVERLKNKFLLTCREAELAVFLTEGRSINEISEVMDICQETTRQYVKNCFKKMGVQKQHELVCVTMSYARKR